MVAVVLKCFPLLVFFVANHITAGYRLSNEIEEHKYTWTNLKEFLDYGWTDASTHKWEEGPLAGYDKPSDFSRELAILNPTSSGVWGWKKKTDYGVYKFSALLDWSNRPEYQGALYLTLNIKYYEYWGTLRVNVFNRVNYFHYSGDTFRYRHSSKMRWRTATYEGGVFNSTAKQISIDVDLTKSEVFIMDEVSLTVATYRPEPSCPMSCTTDCKFKAIDCHNYYKCVNGTQKETFSCKAEDGLAYNPKTESCDFIHNVENCAIPEKQPAMNQKCEYRAHEESTNLYQFCLSNDVSQTDNCTEMECPTGFVWKINADDENRKHQCLPSMFVAS